MKLGSKEVGIGYPTYFIADIGSNHNGDFDQARRLIYLAAESGANAVKFQHFKAETIVSDYGFKQLGPSSHQAEWEESVYDTYVKYQTPLDWVPELKDVADGVGVDFLTTPYDPDMINYLSEYVCAWKIGSGDITYEQLIKRVLGTGKPLILSTGASTPEDIVRAMGWIGPGHIDNMVLMHCNTNYTNDPNNISYVNLKVLPQWWGGGVIGFSDHTWGHTAVLGAVALAARVIEKHFTEDNAQNGPDHKYAMTPITWRTMIDTTRELELSLGDGVKKVEENELETVVLQRRAIRATRNLAKGERISKSDIAFLRPCPKGALAPYQVSKVLDLKVRRDVQTGECILEDDL